jgi:hypothetical protein
MKSAIGLKMSLICCSHQQQALSMRAVPLETKRWPLRQLLLFARHDLVGSHAF